MTVFAKQNPTSGSQLSATRSSFMITDILAAKVGDDIVNERVHMPAGNLNDFDSDEDFDADGNSSVCSNGKFPPVLSLSDLVTCEVNSFCRFFCT